MSSAAKRAPVHCSRTARCRSGWMLARNRTSASREASRELRLEVLEDVEVGLQRVADVDVALVAAGPEERLAARDVLDVVGDHAAVVQDGVLLLAEVVADGPDHAGLGEERGGEREVHGGAAQQAVALAGLGLDGVKGDGSDHGERHKAQEGSAWLARAALACLVGMTTFADLGLSEPTPAGPQRRRLSVAEPDPGAGDPAAARGPRRDRPGADGNGQDGRLRPAAAGVRRPDARTTSRRSC